MPILPTAKSMATFLLFTVTAIAEIVGCYLPYRWLREGGSPWLLAPAAISLAAFALLLTLHPAAAGRTYAAYGGVYISVAIAWLWAVEGIRPTGWDFLGVLLTLSGMAVIALQPR
jgi:small multidrug resistance family-3 protein